MALTSQGAKGVVVGLASLVSLAVNPNFEIKDLKEPHAFYQKFNNHKKYDHSGKIYTLSAVAGLGATMGLTYCALTGKLIARKKEENHLFELFR
jgi:hypothetical protein